MRVDCRNKAFCGNTTLQLQRRANAVPEDQLPRCSECNRVYSYNQKRMSRHMRQNKKFEEKSIA